MDVLFIIVLLGITVGRAAANFECFCNFMHPEYYVLPCPDQNHQPIGTIAMPDHVLNTFYKYDLNVRYCKAKLTGVNPPAGYEAILHYGQLAYLQIDAGFRHSSCTGQASFNRGNLKMSSYCNHHIIGPIGLVTTATPTTAPPPHGHWITLTQAPHTTSSTPSYHWIGINNNPQLVQPGAPPKCRIPGVDAAISGGKTVYHSDARLCGVGGVSYDEALPLSYCNILEPSQWKQYLQVKPNCAMLSMYVPISVFINGKLRDGDGSGVFMGCTASGGFRIARQTCASGQVEVVEISPGHPGILENVDNYFVIQ